MRDWLIVLVLLFFSLWVVLHGVLMIFSPKTVMRLVDWYSRADAWCSANPEWKPGFSWNSRLGGVGVLVVGGLMARAAIIWMLETSHAASHATQPQTAMTM